MGIEGVEILRRSHRQLLDLSLRHPCAGALLDQFGHLIERRLQALLGDDPSNFVRKLLVGQPECGIEWRDPLDADGLI